MRKIISGIMSVAMAAGLVIPIKAEAERIIITQTTAPSTAIETAESMAIETATTEPKTIYRGSFDCLGNNYNVLAKSNGNIHIDIYCSKNYHGSSHDMGFISFNDTMIAPVDEQGYAGISSFENYNYFTKNIIAYDGDYTIYNVISNGDTYMGNLYATYDLYVKESYLTTNQTLYISNDEITIPFGNPPIDYQTQIENLITENNELKSQINSLSSFLNTYGNRAYGDMNGDGFCDARDATILLTFYARQSVGEVLTLDQLINEQKGNS